MNDPDQARVAARALLCVIGAGWASVGALATVCWVADAYGRLPASLLLLSGGAALLRAGLRGGRA